ncbi:hypothetical protein NMG60_11036324 [Bertholletia excelsa]
MTLQKFTRMRLRFGLIKLVNLFDDLGQLVSLSCSRPYGLCSMASKPIFTNASRGTHDSSLPCDHSAEMVNRLISIFTTRPFDPDNQQLRDLSVILSTEIVERVLKNLKSWKIALIFFNWASNQCGYKHNCYTYNAMASVLSSARQIAPLRVLAMNLLNSRCCMTPGALGYFIRCLASQGLVEEAASLFDQVKKMGICVPNTYTYNCLLEALSNSNSTDLSELRLKEMLDSGLEPDKYTFTPLLQCYCKAGKFEKALNVFNHICQKGWIDSYVLSILAVSFSKWGKVDEAFELIHRMQEKLGISLNEKTFCILIHGFVSASRVDKALQLFDKMQKLGFTPDISIYDVLIGALCKTKELGKAVHLFLEMEKLGICSDIEILTKLVSSFPGEREILQLIERREEDLDAESMLLLYNSVMSSLVNSGSVDAAYHLLKAMIGQPYGEVEVDKILKTKRTVLPNTTSFEIVVNGLCQLDKLDVALGLFRYMDRIHCKRSLLLYNNLINSLCNSNRVEECYEILREMKEKGFKPTNFTHNSIFGCFCRKEDVGRALDMVREMRVNGHEPWIKHTTLLVKQLCQHGRPVEACNFLASMVEEGFLLDIIPYSAVIHGFLKIHEVDLALKLFRDICARGYNPDLVSYNIIMKGLCRAGRVSEAEDVLDEMLDKGLCPSVVTYNLLIDGWCKTFNIDRAMLCLSRMVQKGHEPNVVTYATLIDGLCNCGRPNEALELWNGMMTNGCSPNRITFMALINGLCKCKRVDTALFYFEQMEEKGMKPDAYIFVALIDACLSNSNPVLAFDILKGMLLKGILLDPIDKNKLIIRDAILKMSEDDRTSLGIKSLIAEGCLPIDFGI